MVKKWAKIFGIVFLLVGVLGFIPGITSDGLLLGIFEVDTVHNIIHLLSGIVALAVSSSDKGAKWYFIVFGVVYALVTVLGFVSTGKVLGLIHVNMADNILHLVIALAALVIGFTAKVGMGSPKKMDTPQTPPAAGMSDGQTM